MSLSYFSETSSKLLILDIRLAIEPELSSMLFSISSNRSFFAEISPVESINSN